MKPHSKIYETKFNLKNNYYDKLEKQGKKSWALSTRNSNEKSIKILAHWVKSGWNIKATNKLLKWLKGHRHSLTPIIKFGNINNHYYRKHYNGKILFRWKRDFPISNTSIRYVKRKGKKKKSYTLKKPRYFVPSRAVLIESY